MSDFSKFHLVINLAWMQLELLIRIRITGPHLKMDLYCTGSRLQPCQTCMVNYVQAKEAQRRSGSSECVTVFAVTAAPFEDRKQCFAGSWYLCSVWSVPAVGSRSRRNWIQNHPWQEVGHRSTTSVSFGSKMREMEIWFVPQDGARVLSGPKVMKRPCQRWLKGKTYHSSLARLATSWALVRREMFKICCLMIEWTEWFSV